MYEIVKQVIGRGEYNLSEMLKKIDSLWVQGRIEDSDREKLTTFAREGARAEGSVDVIRKLSELELRVAALEQSRAEEEEPGTGDSEAEEEYLAYVPGKWYYAGDKMNLDGKLYICSAPAGVVCVWSPYEYPEYWDEVA